MANYKQLKVWQKAMDFVAAIYQLTAVFPETEKYGLTSQMRRAAISIPSNIAEGYSRASRKDYLRFVNIAKGSSAELETQLLLTEKLGFVKGGALSAILSELQELGRMLSGLENALKTTESATSLAPRPQPLDPRPQPLDPHI